MRHSEASAVLRTWGRERAGKASAAAARTHGSMEMAKRKVRSGVAAVCSECAAAVCASVCVCVLESAVARGVCGGVVWQSERRRCREMLPRCASYVCVCVCVCVCVQCVQRSGR